MFAPDHACDNILSVFEQNRPVLQEGLSFPYLGTADELPPRDRDLTSRWCSEAGTVVQ
jgi:hypothetical protein